MPVPAVELKVGNRTVRVTSPDKVYFPDVGITKRQMVEYVIAVGDGIFAALQDRAVTMERWPGGYRPDVKLSTRSDSHLGHVFSGEGYDTPTDDRYCINSVSLTLEPKA